jgi:hypothetical protein
MKRIALNLVVFASVAATASAAILLSDNFTYPDGAIVGAPGSPWQANTGNPGTALVTNQQLEVTFFSARSEDIAAPLSAPVEIGGAVPAVYSSFTIRFFELPNASGSYLAHFTGMPLSAHRGRLWASMGGAAAGKLRLGIVNSSTGNASTAPWPNDLDTNVTYRVVTRLDVASGAATLWIDPASESDPSVTASDTPGVTNIHYYAFRQASGVGVSRIDDLKVGTTFNDVAGANNPPTLSSIPNQNIPANTSTPALPFTIGDAETPAANLIVTASSTNQTLVPDANITLGGSGASRTVTVTPAQNQQGLTAITITVSDAGGASVLKTFILSVGLPSISDIPHQATPTNQPTSPIAFTIGDAETPGSLVVTATSDNQTLLPNANIALGGAGANRTITLTPAADQAGYAVITVNVSDGELTASDTFILTVFPTLGVIKEDDFNRLDGPVVDGSGAWLSHSGTFQDAQITNGTLKLIAALTEDVSTELTNRPYAPASGAILYASFTVTCLELPSTTGSYFAHFKDDGALGFRARVFASTANAAPGTLRLGLANATSGASVQFPTDLATNVPHLVVTRYNTATGISTLWVNPASEFDPNVTATDSPNLLTVHTYAFRQAPGIGTLCVDDLKVGGALADVGPTGYRLHISALGDDVEVSYPAEAEADGLALQFKQDLSQSMWSNVPANEITTEGDRRVARYTNTTGMRFFRLFKP